MIFRHGFHGFHGRKDKVNPCNPCLKIINVSVLQHIPILATLPYFHAGTVISSRPISRIVSIISSKRCLDGFFVPLTYCANRLCDKPNRRATAEAFSSG